MITDFDAENKVLRLKPGSKLTAVTSPELEKLLKDRLFEARKLIVDMSDTEYVSSAGLRVLLWAHKIMLDKDGMVIVGVNEVVREILDITGFSDIFNIE